MAEAYTCLGRQGRCIIGGASPGVRLFKGYPVREQLSTSADAIASPARQSAIAYRKIIVNITANKIKCKSFRAASYFKSPSLIFYKTQHLGTQKYIDTGLLISKAPAPCWSPLSNTAARLLWRPEKVQVQNNRV